MIYFARRTLKDLEKINLHDFLINKVSSFTITFNSDISTSKNVIFIKNESHQDKYLRKGNLTQNLKQKKGPHRCEKTLFFPFCKQKKMPMNLRSCIKKFRASVTRIQIIRIKVELFFI